jgi:hypothetical protein
MAGFLRAVSVEAGATLSDENVAEMLADPRLRESLAMATYGRQLMLRAKGKNEGRAVLALWREFAWTKGGTPKRGYVLDADKILTAENVLRARIAS